MAARLEEAGIFLINGIAIAKEQNVSRLYPTQPKLGKFYALSILHILKQLISTENSHAQLNKALTHTE